MTNRESSEENYSSEIARINDLVLPYLYDIGFRYIEREVRVNLGSRLIYVDIVAYLDNTMDTPVAIAEVRRNINSTPSLLDPAVQQAFSASAALGDSVKYLLISDGIRHHWFERVLEKQNLIVLQTHPQIDHRDRAVFQPNLFVDSLIPVSDPALYRHLLQSAIEIMKKEGLSFSIRMAIEINKIIIAKLYDESQNQNLDTKDYKFSVSVDNPINIPEQIHALYQNALVAAGSQPLEPDQWNLSPNTLTSIVRLLDPYYISSVNPEVLDRTFWEMFPNLLRRDESIYTTPRPLASLVSQLAHLGAKEKLIDPACGSGLLLLETYRRHGGGLHAIDIQSKIGSSGYVTGIEVNSEVAKLAATNFVISGLAHSSIVNANSLDIQNLENLGIKLGGYDVVVSSPPFGVMSSKDSNYLDYYETAKVNSNNHVEVLFLELSLLLLRPGGRAVLLVPDSLLSSPHFVSVRKWLLSNTTNRAIISLPPESLLARKSDGTS
jgi:SAM-dependent methyltransferase